MNDYMNMISKMGYQVTPARRKIKNAPDVSIAFRKNSRQSIAIYLKDANKFPERVSPLVLKDRIYFCFDPKGYCITKKTKSDRIDGEIKIAYQEAVDHIRDFVGDFSIKYDEMAETYYIEKEKKDE